MKWYVPVIGFAVGLLIGKTIDKITVNKDIDVNVEE